MTSRGRDGPACPSCGAPVNAATLAMSQRGQKRTGDDDLRLAKPGDISICLYCEALLRYVGEPGALGLRRTCFDELRRDGGSKLVQAVRRARRMVRLIPRRLRRRPPPLN